MQDSIPTLTDEQLDSIEQDVPARYAVGIDGEGDLHAHSAIAGIVWVFDGTSDTIAWVEQWGDDDPTSISDWVEFIGKKRGWKCRHDVESTTPMADMAAEIAEAHRQAQGGTSDD
jgi:hypothetical protein